MAAPLVEVRSLTKYFDAPSGTGKASPETPGRRPRLNQINLKE